MKVTAILIGLATSLAMAGCGGEHIFTAQDFVEEMNDNGAALALGPVLTKNPDGADVYTVRLTEFAPSAVGQKPPPSDVHGAATLLIAADPEAGREEFDRCEGAPILTCFRASNAVLRVEDLPPADQARITTALEALATNGD